MPDSCYVGRPFKADVSGLFAVIPLNITQLKVFNIAQPLFNASIWYFEQNSFDPCLGVPGEEVVPGQHLAHPQPQARRVRVLPGPHLPVCRQVERELGEDPGQWEPVILVT